MDSELQVGKIFLKLNNIIAEDLDGLKFHISKAYLTEGEMVFRYGEQVGQLNYLAKGQVKVINLNSFGQEKMFSLINAGFFLCEAVFFTKTCNYSLVIATKPCEIWRFSYDYVMNELCVNYPEVALYLLKTISLKMVGMYNQINDLSMKNPRRAIAHFVCSLIEGQGTQMNDGSWSVGIKMSHQQMADFLGLHRVTVTKALGALKDEGLVIKTPKGFGVGDLARLREIIEE